MKNRWNDNDARSLQDNPLQLRVYTSRLLGQEPSLVLHGGGNTSVKAAAANLFGDTEDILYVKGSGWDLATIEKEGFAPVRLQALERMAELAQISDTQMIAMQRSAMTDPNAPTPSVEAILHAIIPFRYVDHTHADAVVAITNTENGQQRVQQIYGPRVLVVPYVMPGFVLAKHVYDLTRDTDWSQLEGMILLNHGVFTFGDTAKDSYDRMIKLVSAAQHHLEEQGATATANRTWTPQVDLLKLAHIRLAVCGAKGSAVVVQLDTSGPAAGFADLPDAPSIATRGPLTPDHVIRTKPIPVILGDEPETDIESFADAYRAYFDRHTNGQITPLDPAPRWAVWPGHGTIGFGSNVKEARITSDIVAHTLDAIQWAQALGGWQALNEKDLFDMEYWELEQAKLNRGSATAALQGKVALVTGAASGIGQACVQQLAAHGAAVAALDINPNIETGFDRPEMLGLVCDVTDTDQVQQAVDRTVRAYGGLDIVISNAGTFPASQMIVETDPAAWNRSLAVNLSSHQLLLTACIPYLQLGVDPAVVIIASKNVAAPGPGVAAYSVAKAGLTQLARVAALELGPWNIRVNVLHPNAVFDTAIWTPEVLESRATHYGLSVDQYKTHNVLGVEVTSKDVAQLACAMAGPLFAKTTGAQVPVDGGNERVI